VPSTGEYERLDVAAQLRDFGRVLREQWWLVALCLLVSAAAAVGYAETRPRDYQATAKLLLQQDNPGNQIVGVGSTFVDPVRQAATDQQLITSGAVAAGVARQLRLGARAGAALSGVGAAVGGNSNVLSVTARNHSAGLAARLANAFAEQYIAFRRRTSGQRFSRALAELERRVRQAPKAARPGLRAQLGRARLLGSAGSADAQVVQRAGVPTATVGPRIAHKLVVGLIFGLLLGVGLALLRDRLDPRVKRVADVKAIFPGVPILAAIPRPGPGKRGATMTVEGFRTLQSNVDVRCPNGQPRSLLVTSAGSGDGKSTTVLNLGLAMNEQRHSALVLEADLRRPALSTGLGVAGGPGLSKVLSGKGTLAEAVAHASVSPASRRRGPSVALAGKLAVVPAGQSPARPRTLLSGDALDSLLVSASLVGDTVLIDGSPLGLFSDMLPLAKRVNGVIVAVRLYHSRRDELERFAEQLVDSEVRPVGLVVLGSSADPSAYDGY
jgi:polysaccharide biosynthesis transport protein